MARTVTATISNILQNPRLLLLKFCRDVTVKEIIYVVHVQNLQISTLSYMYTCTSTCSYHLHPIAVK